MKLHLLLTSFVITLACSLVAAEPVAITVIEDFSDPKDNPQFNADVAAALVTLAQSHPLILSYRVVEETSEAHATQAKFEAFGQEMPAAPLDGQRLGDYQRAVAKFQTDLAKWKNDYLDWRDTQQASAEAWLAGALRKQTETSQRFARELARRGHDYRRSDCCGAVLQATKMDFPQGYRGFAILLSDLRDQPAGRAGRATPLKELPPEITLVLAHPSATRSPLIVGLPNRIISAPTLTDAVKLVTKAIAPANTTALAEKAPLTETP